ncbi:MAG: hypothetical protein JXB62_17775 [Pirellulales bacterium]|nr:hypothetical protein [Pirellulales bacterium]
MSFTKLAEPAIAERVELTDAQRTQVAALLQQRADALAAAAQPERPAILAASEQQLGAVLTAEQKVLWAEIKPEPKLRFSFRFQRWVDVLEWFAEQADLSLVLDAPPPGTFNYTDAKEYTPTEAIDLLNGVLLTKGYTLIRRGRMLLVIDLSEGVLEGLVPQVSLEELERRGKFELVTVQFPLGRRPVATVQGEIAPLLGPHGKVVPMPATSQILVTDTAGIMRAVNAVIESIAEPPVVPTPPVPETPVMQAYSVKPADPKLLMEAITSLAPSAKVVLDEKADQLHVHAVPSEQALIESVLKAMQESNPPETQPRLETYPVAEPSAEQLLETLQTIVPEARLTLDKATGRLVSWATGTEQEMIQETIEKLGGEGSPAATRQLEVYRLTKVDPATALSLLQSILPDARLAVDPQTRVLIAVAVPDDQQVIRTTLQQLQPERPGPDIPELRFYPLALTLNADAVTALKQTVPGATVALEASGDRLMVVATPKEHEKVQATIGQIEKAAFAKLQSKLVVYPVSGAQRKRFLAVLDSLSSRLPGIRIVEDAEPGELSIWAKPQQHEVMTEILDEFKRDVPEDQQYQLATYPIVSADPESVMSVLEEMFPDTKIVLDQEAKRLLVWARPAQQDAIRSSLERLRAPGGLDGAGEMELRVYPFPYPATQAAPANLIRRRSFRMRPNAAYPPAASSSASSPPELAGSPGLLSALEQLVPEAQFTLDAENQRLIVVATPADHAVIKKTLDQLASEPPPEQMARFEVYPIRRANADALIATLQPLLPEVKLSADAKTGDLVAWGTPREQEMLKEALGKLTRGGTGGTLDETPQAEVYRLSKADPATTLKLLQDMLPDAQLSIDPQTGSLVALAVPADQQAIKSTLDQLQSDEPDPNAPELVFYPLKQPAPESLLDVLENAAPKAKITLAPDGKHVTVYASPADQAVVKAIVDRVEQSAPPAEKNQLAIYPVTSAQRKRFDAVLTMLQAEMPEIKVIADAEPGELAIWARPSEHETIRGVLEQLEHETPEQEKYRLVVYPIASTDPQSVLTTLQGIYPDTQLVLDAKANRLLVWTGPDEHESIQSSIDQITAKAPAEQQPRFEVYPIHGTSAATLLASLTPLVPNARITTDPKTGNLVAWGTPAEHDTLKAAIGALGRGGALQHTAQVEVYRLGKLNPTTTLTLLQKLLPDAELTVDAQTGNLIAVAVAADQQALGSLLEQLQADQRGPDDPELRFYPLSQSPPASLTAVLQQLAPEARVTVEADQRRLMVVASPGDHEIIKTTIERIETTLPPEEKNLLMVYPVTSAQKTRFEAVLPELTADMEGIKVIAGGEPGELAVWAKPTQHVVIGQMLDRLEQEVPEQQKYQLAAYPLTSADPESVLGVLEDLFPNTKVVLDKKARRITVWARPDDQEAIRQAIEQMDSGQPGAALEKIMVYPVADADPTVILGMIQDLLPDVKVQHDATAGTIVARATQRDHEQIKQVVEQMQQGATGFGARTLRVYPYPYSAEQAAPPGLRSAFGRGYRSRLTGLSEPPSGLLAALQQLVPKAQLTLDDKGKRLIAVATPADHEILETTLKQVELSIAFEAQGELIAHPIRGADPESLLSLMQDVFPEINVVLDAKGKRLLVYADPQQQQQIKMALERMDPAGAGGGQETFVAYPVQGSDPQIAIEMLEELLPGVALRSDATAETIIARATAEDHAVIAAALEQILAGPDEEHRPKLVVYPAGHGNPATMRLLIAEMVPKAQIVADVEKRTVAALATPDDHEIIKAAVAGMSQAEPPETAPRAVVYTLESNDERSAYFAYRLLRNAVPDATLTVGADPSQIIAWARPEDHKLLEALIEQMAQEAPPEKAPKLVVYPLKAKSAESVEEVFSTVVPNAQITVDRDNPKNLMVWARQADHDVIKSLLEQIDVEEPADAAAKAVLYLLEGRRTTSSAYYTLQLLRDAVPNATFTMGADPNQLIAWARPEDHKVIKELVDQLSGKGSPETTPTMQVYALQAKTAETVMEVLASVVPDAKLIAGEDPRELIAWARPDEHQEIQSAIEKLDTGDPAEGEVTMTVYPLQAITATAALPILQKEVPTARFQAGTDPNQLIAWARPAEHEKITQTLSKLAADEPEATAPRIGVYTLDIASLSAVPFTVRLLAQAVPEANFSIGTRPNQLVVWARPDDHKKIEQMIQQMAVKGPPEKQPAVTLYTLQSITAATAMQFLASIVPEAKLAAGDDPSQLIAWATPADHQEIKSAIEKLDVEEVPDQAATVTVYSLKSTTATEALAVLAPIVPNAKLNPGADPGQFVAWARPADHAKIKQTLAQLDAGETAAAMQAYTLQSTTAEDAIAVLAAVVPNATLNAGTDPSQLIAWARPTDHEKIKQTLATLDVEEPVETAPTLAVYALQKTTAAAAITALAPVVPNATLSAGTDPNQLIAWARPADHEKIQETVARFDAEEPAATARTAVVYDLEEAGIRGTVYRLRLLQEAVPEASLTLGAEAGQLVAWARPADHEKIKQIVEQLAAKGPPEKRPTMEVYVLQSTTAEVALQVLETAFPDAQFAQGDDTSQVIAWARPDDHAEIQKAIASLDVQQPAGKAVTAVVYTLQSMAAEDAVVALTPVVPNATLNAGSQPSQLIAVARPDDHLKIKQTIDKMDAAEPPEVAHKAMVYDIEEGNIRAAIYKLQLLEEAVPEATFTLGADPGQVVAWARPVDHDKIKQIVEQLSAKGAPEKRSTVAVYALKSKSAEDVLEFLASVVPDAELTVGDDPGQLIAYARPADQEEIRAALEKLDVAEPAETAARAVTYTLKTMTAADAIAVLSAAVPNAQLSAGSDPNQLLAWARPLEHKIIQEAVENMSQQEPEETAPRAEVYTLDRTDAAAAMQFLVTAIPQAKFSVGTDPRQLIAWARPADHARIKQAVENMSQQEPPETARKLVTYALETTGAARAITLLTPAVPDAQLSVGTDPGQLIAYARPADHEIIRSAVDQMEADALRDTGRTLAVYPMRKEDVPALLQVLDPVLKQSIRLVPDPNRDSLVVWATPKHQEAVKNAVDQFTKSLPEPVEPTSHVYRFRKADPRAALAVLTALVPQASIALDAGNRSLVVSALPDDHEKIQETIDKMDLDDPEWSPTLKIHRLTSADPTNLMSALQTLFVDHPEVQLSLDTRNNAVIAKASPDQHKTIDELIQEVEAADAGMKLELHSLKNVDPYSVTQVLEMLLQRQGAQAELSIDTGSNQLIAIALPTVHDAIREALEQMRTGERHLEIFQLDYVEIATAELAINTLFRDEGYTNIPDIDADPDTQQLFVRGTKEQLTEIRELLIKMGEAGLTSVQSSGSDRLRVIPFHGDSKAALEQIQRVWPQLRKNPIRVVAPSAVTPLLRDTEEPDPPGAKGDDGPPGAEGPAGTTEEPPADTGTPVEAAADTPSEEPPAVLVVLGEGSITAASEDPEALDQFESLLRAMSQRTGYVGRDFSIYPVRNASASAVAATLMQLLRAGVGQTGAAAPGAIRGSLRTTSRSRLVIVPDERLNTLLVQGSRSDRAKIEHLLTILDTDEVPQTLATRQPKMIPIKNTKASRIEQVIREMFGTQLSSRAAGARSMPSWLSSQMTVDEITNSLVVKAPSPLIDDITSLAETLDEAAGEDPSRGLKLIPLKRANAKRIQQALDVIIQDAVGLRQARP